MPRAWRARPSRASGSGGAGVASWAAPRPGLPPPPGAWLTAADSARDSPCHTPRSARPRAFARLRVLRGSSAPTLLGVHTRSRPRFGQRPVRGEACHTAPCVLGAGFPSRHQPGRGPVTRALRPVSLPGQRRARGRGEWLSRHSTGRAPHGPGTRASARSTAAACTRSRVRGLTSTGRNVNPSPRTRETEARADGQEPARSAAGAGATSHTRTAGQGHLRGAEDAQRPREPARHFRHLSGKTLGVSVTCWLGCEPGQGRGRRGARRPRGALRLQWLVQGPRFVHAARGASRPHPFAARPPFQTPPDPSPACTGPPGADSRRKHAPPESERWPRTSLR